VRLHDKAERRARPQRWARIVGGDDGHGLQLPAPTPPPAAAAAPRCCVENPYGLARQAVLLGMASDSIGARWALASQCYPGQG